MGFPLDWLEQIKINTFDNEGCLNQFSPGNVLLVKIFGSLAQKTLRRYKIVTQISESISFQHRWKIALKTSRA
tara:strand:+ start:1851 stop:2069 length:219 start_codon:yes stop_codon:yes gene_type:complete